MTGIRGGSRDLSSVESIISRSAFGLAPLLWQPSSWLSHCSGAALRDIQDSCSHWGEGYRCPLGYGWHWLIV